MNLSRNEADAQLAAIDDVVARVKQSRIYRVAGEIAMMWGLLNFVGYGLRVAAPGFVWGSATVDGFGVALTILMLRRAGVRQGARIGRAVGAFALFYAFGFLWSHELAQLNGRELTVFWHTLFLFGYCLAGLWFGYGFFVIGGGLTFAILAVYAFAGPWFWLLTSLVTGCGYILCGYWMRRA